MSQVQGAKAQGRHEETVREGALVLASPSSSAATTPDELVTAGELIASPRGESHYVASASMSDKGLGYHKERSVFCEVCWGEHLPLYSVKRLLNQGARVAAASYVERIGRMTFGLLGPSRSARRPNTVYLSAFGVNLLKIMGFSEFDPAPPQLTAEQASSTEARTEDVCFGVESGFLAARHVDQEQRGRLVIRWSWDEDSEQEVFETEVQDYVPRLAGKKGSWLGRLFYRLTQVNFHKLVMWGYHWWVRHNREALLLRAARELESVKQLGCEIPRRELAHGEGTPEIVSSS